MKGKRAYMLVESVVAISIILLMSFSFISLNMLLNNSYKKTQCTQFLINEISNTLIVFKNSDFVFENNFNLNNFEDSISSLYNAGALHKNDLSENVWQYELPFNKDFSYNENGVYTLKISIQYDNENDLVSYSANAYNANNLYYETPLPFHKAVQL